MAKSKPVAKKKTVPVKKSAVKKVSKPVKKPLFSPEEEAKLKHWIGNQRYKYKLGKLTEEQIERLESIPNWTWINRTRFDQAVNAIKNYVDRTGDINPPTGYRENGRNLKLCIYNFKKRYQNKKLDEYQINALENIDGWTWEFMYAPRSNVRFDEMLIIAKAYLNQ